MGAKPATHYEILGVARQADHEQIRRAYLAAARRWHPDRHSGKPAAEAAKAEQAMRRVNQAWSVLGDRASREAYDRQIVPHGGYPGATGESRGIRTDDGVTRIDPRLLDPNFLNARRDAQLHEISTRSSFVLRAVPLLAVLGLLAAIFVFTAYARTPSDVTTDVTVPGPNLGAGIAANDCVVVMSGPSLLEVPCTATADGRVFGARLPDGVCPLGTDREVELTNGAIVCLDSVG
ncbi:MAG: DnaJ domain-containing protein [Actinomycetota bacterium]